jgi:hypothetical protein
METWIAVLLGLLFSTAVPAASANATHSTRGTLTVVSKNTSTEYVSAAGKTSSTYPGALATGDRIFASDTDLVGGKTAGFDNEICTVTFNGNDLCHDVAVLSGKGDIELTWLWIGRNNSAYGPQHWSGVIDGGTGAFAKAHGGYLARILPNGTVQISVPLN